MTESLRFDQVCFRAGGKTLTDNVSTGFCSGKIHAVIGPNGSGKSTLLKLAAGLLTPHQGQISLQCRPLQRFSHRGLARELAMLPQSSPRPLGMRVEDLVACGRHPHRSVLGMTSRQDRELTEWALSRVNLWPRRKDTVDGLSGGEMQRVWLALVLAQNTPLLLLDEPTSYLDLHHQFELLELIREINRELDKTVIWVLHDINQALQYSHQVTLVDGGRIRFSGTPEALLETDLLDQVFQVRNRRITLEDGSLLLHSQPHPPAATDTPVQSRTLESSPL